MDKVVKLESIELIGKEIKERILVKVNGIEVLLTYKSFFYLFKLAIACIKNEDGWVEIEELELGWNQSRYLYRLKQEIKDRINIENVFENNNHQGAYRLLCLPENVQINYETLSQLNDSEISRIARGCKL